MKFRDLKVGDTFDFISPNRMMNSFYETCTKTGTRTYEWVNRQPEHQTAYGLKSVAKYTSRVGTINCEVYHVNGAEEETDLSDSEKLPMFDSSEGV